MHHSLRETRFEAWVEVEVVRRAVGCKYDLLVTGEHEAVEDVEKRAHRFLLLVAELLHVVYQQNVDVFHVFEHGVSAQLLNVHLVDIARDEHVGADVFHACTGLVGHDVGLNREQEVRLAVSRRTPDENRVEKTAVGLLGHAACHAIRHDVGIANNIGVKGKVGACLGFYLVFLLGSILKYRNRLRGVGVAFNIR